MPKVKTVLTEALITQLGLSIYRSTPRAGFFNGGKQSVEKEITDMQAGQVVSEEQPLQQIEEVDFVETETKPTPEPIPSALNTLEEIEAHLKKTGKIAKIPSPAEAEMENGAEFGQIAPLDSVSESVMDAHSVGRMQWIWVGQGVSQVWQQPDQLAWRLWLNILTAFQLSAEQTQFFDTAQLHDETAWMQCAEQVMAAGLDFVFVSEEVIEHPAVAYLAEGVEVVEVPSLERMLEEPQAKQQFYQKAVEAQSLYAGF